MSDYKGRFKSGADNNNWNLAFDLIKDSSNVIDIGCSSGNFGLALKENKNCSVDGVEPGKGDFDKAKQVLDQVYHDTVENLIDTELKGKKYDTVVFLDVIEHLHTPVETLRSVKKILKDNGSVVFSIPNVAHISVRLMLMQGDFEYGKTGILDNTHTHFYTEKEVNRVFNEAGYEIKKLKAMTVGYSKEALKRELHEIGINKPSADLIGVLDSNNSHVYQFVGLAKPVSNPKYSLLERKFQSPQAKRLFEESFNLKLKEIKDTHEHKVHEHQDRIRYLNAQLRKTNESLERIHNSYSFRVGRAVLTGPRFTRKIFKKFFGQKPN